MNDRIITPNNLGFDNTGWPTHCNIPMQDDVDWRLCTNCSGIVKVGDMMRERDRRGIKKNY